MTLFSLNSELKLASSQERAESSKRFFKTKKGQYGEGDVFIGISMPNLRSIIKNYKNLSFNDLQELLSSEIHEFRMTALLILNEKIKTKSATERTAVYDFYVLNFQNINNWDLVDCSCHEIVGKYLLDKDRSILEIWANTDHLWTQRIAIVSTWHFIRKNQVSDTIKIAEILIHHHHDLIHKATGWMLREAHKRSPAAIEIFLDTYAPLMPRTALRYSIEKFSLDKKACYMQLK